MSDIKVITEQKEVEDTTPKEEPEKKVEEEKEEPALTTQTGSGYDYNWICSYQS